ncbi:flagella biosynthesis chaperone for FliD, FliT [Shewanella sp. MEBiC00475]|uniref:flagella biosynthesis chaperone for FliD, FliT n=1 Tax=Shewanella sp. MEBiC00475 TaxID=2575361 RepID=UPI0010C13C87|nr:flagella biosynthesis chaperone for FliD, FliT [Shewanella sp. MEBiC00475]
MTTTAQKMLIDDLDATSEQCRTVLDSLKSKNETEEFDKLVLDLQELVTKRQNLLDVLIADDSFVQKDYLQRQLELTLSLEVKAKLVMKSLHAEIHLGKKNQRQVNVYKSIDSDR